MSEIVTESVGTSVLKGPFTFTSLTVYLAHHAIVGQTMTQFPGNFTPVWGTTMIRSAGIVPLRADQVSSVRPLRQNALQMSGLAYAQLVANGTYDQAQYSNRWEMSSFNFAHLQNPVPASVYYDARSNDCWGGLKQSHCGTITDDTFRPQLAFGNKVWASIASDWFDCYQPGLVDPAIVLHPVQTTLAAPLLAHKTTAQPGLFRTAMAHPYRGSWPRRSKAYR
jgi:hypothetical protein